ncbi:acyl-CoA dehydrogenase family protein [Deinococcus sp. KNUC1210]|uniref:acyl-CoA dehydrogenase family protein n=1 Tax=Deinococcus sp. KNUC1210 TaxID=2917691 RepID=UPI001EF06810|nr:acyl-CoA dehydrogenase family protein [Deinococcus sp. KNUC1210]ULH15398.1 acyl-CoA dehydrogenase family protein [Deinococcus sp. KNUC1210]
MDATKDSATAQAAGLLAQLDMDRLSQLARRIDLPALLNAASQMNDGQLKQLARTLSPASKERDLPAPHGDFYGLMDMLSDRQRDIAARVRHFMETEVAPIMNEYWSRDEFPRQLIPKMRELNLMREIWNDDGTRTPDASVTEGIIIMEMCRVDVSTAVFFGVHAGLALASVALGGDERQRTELLPPMLDLDVIGAFGLTEPEGGSQVSQGLRTTARRDGDSWILNGEKKWIGNSTFSDITVIWARDEADQQVKGFVVRAGTPGFEVEKIQGKVALRIVENGHIRLTDCRVPEADRLQQATSFRTTADVLRLTRAGVAWQGVGCAMGAYELALNYAQTREQFGKKIGAFQLIQNHLVHMLGNVTAMQMLCLRLSQMEDAGTMRDQHAALAKVFTAARCRETVALARESFGGNGILLEYGVAKHFCDTEAIYSYEGTNEINTLVVGRAITGLSAFV